ncbi:MAG: hypothetical protein L6Q99_18185 [Planctomycetes bacterium]|nr:hypothetical protein [Planctomycetota bacterium]
MNARHDARHEARLAEAVAARSPAAIADLLRDCATCRDDWYGLEALGKALDDVGEELRLDRPAVPAAGSGADDRDEVLRAIRRARGERVTDARSSLRRAPRWGWWLAAAAALVLAFVAYQRFGEPGEEPEIVLGAPLETVAPRGRVTDFAEFQGRGVRPAGGFFRISVFAPGAATPLLVSPPLDTPQWRPTAEELASLPATIEWRLESFVAGGESRVSPRAAATRP